MATEQVPRTRCDRPGCNAVVTENGGRFYLCDLGLIWVGPPPADESEPCNMVNTSEPLVKHCSVDLCRACKDSLQGWWASKEARAATKAVGK